MLVAIAVSVWIWSRIGKRDPRLVLIYIGALISAFIGAKVAYVAAEGWLHWNDPNRWLVFSDGQIDYGSVAGRIRWRGDCKTRSRIQDPDGRSFCSSRAGWNRHWTDRLHSAWLLPGTSLRAGMVHDQGWDGIARWPAAEVELLFNVCAAAILAWLRWRRVLPGQLFHVYLIAYGLFRFTHEFLRATPRIAGVLSGYQIAALLIAGLGCVGFWLRQRRGTTPEMFAPAVQGAITPGPQ